jgi:predicted hydrocarbon binding protein
MTPLVPIEVDERTGVWTTDGLPMLYVPRHFFVNNHLAVEAALGREKYAEILYSAGHKSAHYWCDTEAKTHGINGLPVFEHYLTRLSQRGWGRFAFVTANASVGEADIRLDDSMFALAEPAATGKICYMFSGWFAGAMDWVTGTAGDEGKSVCHETQCCAEGHSHCVFAVRTARVAQAR